MLSQYWLPLLWAPFLKTCLSAPALVHDQYVLDHGDDTMASIESDRLELLKPKAHYNLNVRVSLHSNPRSRFC